MCLQNKIFSGYAQVVITGKVGSGKTTFLRIAQKQGYATLSLDEEVKKLYTNEIVIQEISKRFTGVVKGGIVNKQQLTSIVFENKQNIYKLESVLYPYLFHQVNRWLKQVHAPSVIEIPLFFEKYTFVYPLMGIVLCVASKAVRKNRVLNRIPSVLFEKINAVQNTPQCVKMQMSDLVIHTEYPKQHTEKQFILWLKEKLY